MHRLLGDLPVDSESLKLQILPISRSRPLQELQGKQPQKTQKAQSLVGIQCSDRLARRLPQPIGMSGRASGAELNACTDKIIGAAIAVHRALGPGLLESAYDACLGYELVKRGLRIEQQKPLPIVYDSVQIDCAYRLDFLVDGEVIVEVKSVARITDVHVAQLLSYLRLLNKRVGLLINFNVKYLPDQGIRRIVNGFPE